MASSILRWREDDIGVDRQRHRDVRGPATGRGAEEGAAGVLVMNARGMIGGSLALPTRPS